MNYLNLENISKSYGEKILFDNISFQVNKGEKIAIVAKNGAGKSTLMRVIAGLEPAEGENKKLWVSKDIKIGYLVQEPEFPSDINILEAVFDSDNPTIKAIRQYEEALIWQDRPEKMEQAIAAMDDLKAWDFESSIKEILFKLFSLNKSWYSASKPGGGKSGKINPSTPAAAAFSA